MRTNAPTKSTTLIAVILAVVALVAVLAAKMNVNLPVVITANAFWILFVSFCFLLAGCLFRKL